MLLLVVFTLFGVGSYLATEIDANPRPPSALSEEIVTRCGWGAGRWGDAATGIPQKRLMTAESAGCAEPTEREGVC